LEWQQLKQEENVRLQEENKKFSDVLFVPNVDVYRNLPSQLLGFYRWYETHPEPVLFVWWGEGVETGWKVKVFTFRALE
jgi:hypothetical protein